MKKVIVYLIMLVVLLFGLSGCFPDGKTNVSNDTDSSIHLEDTNLVDISLAENLIVKADVSENHVTHMRRTDVSFREFDQNWVDSFLINKSIAERYDFESEFFPEYKAIGITCDDGSRFRTDKGELDYCNVKYDERYYESTIFGSNVFVRADLKEVYTKNDLDNIDKDNAIQLVSQEIKKLDISVVDTPEVIALDYETMQSEWTDFETKDGTPPRKWEKEDEGYLILYEVVYDGEKILDSGYMDNNKHMYVSPSYVMAVVTSDGIIHFRCKGIYNYEEPSQSEIVPISLEIALEQVKNKYKNIVLTDPILISDIKLVYVPVIKTLNPYTYELVPAWAFLGKQTVHWKDAKKGSSDYDVFYTIMISAEDGHEMK